MRGKRGFTGPTPSTLYSSARMLKGRWRRDIAKWIKRSSKARGVTRHIIGAVGGSDVARWHGEQRHDSTETLRSNYAFPVRGGAGTSSVQRKGANI